MLKVTPASAAAPTGIRNRPHEDMSQRFPQLHSAQATGSALLLTLPHPLF
jgi:hypothetical protein